jgi:thiamine-phosphate pyrophosphorylase
MTIISVKDYMKLYLVLETSLLKLPLGDFIIQAIEGGVTAIQLRDKTASTTERYNTAKTIKTLINGRDVLFIVNNTADIAMAAGAHGVHLGASDLPPHAVRQAFPKLVIGYSCNNTEDYETAISTGVHYAGVGPAFRTQSKTDLRPVIGANGVAHIAKKLNIPSVAIGGINLNKIKLIHGTNGVAVLSALCKSKTPYDDAAKFIKMMG